MKLKDKNDVVQEVIDASLKELSKVFSITNKVNAEFSLWFNRSFLDNDKNLCIRGAIDFHLLDGNGKVGSFKMLLDRVLVLRDNIGTLDKPKYGKQRGYEELRRVILNEIVGKAIGGLAFGLQEKTKEQIEEFNKIVEETES